MEAMELTAGLPYKKLGKVQMTSQNIVEEPIQEEPAPEEEPVSEIEIVVDSADYEKIVEYYTDKNGKLSYDLLNKDMIQYAHSSNAVSKMIENDESIDDIRLYVVGARFRKITENPDLTDEQVIVIVELLDEVSPKGVFKEFDAELRRMKANKNK